MTIERSKQEILEAIEGSAGLITVISQKLKCAWHTAHKLVNLDEDTKRAYKDEDEKVLDLAESELIKAIKKGDLQSIRYILSTKGKRRGYGEKVEVELTKLDELIAAIKKI